MKNRAVFLIFLFNRDIRSNNYNYISIKTIFAICLAFCFGIFILTVLAVTVSQMIAECPKPHIIIIIADDLGWNDIGFHGSNEIPTPNIDALAYHGAILNRHYTQSMCTPSRAALVTGKYPIRMGLQGKIFGPDLPVSLPLKETLLPQYLKKQGYTTGLIGKWHLGYYKNASTPNERGYDSYFGFYGGYVRYNDSKIDFNHSPYDARRNYERAGDEFAGKYNTDVYTDEAVRVISSHDSSKPLFLQVSYTALHAILGSKLQVRDFQKNEKQFAYIKDPNRRMFAGVLSAMDESVGRIIKSLDDSGLLANSVVLFISDNGAQSSRGNSDFTNYGSNWPLRGMKGSVLEGSVRCPAVIWNPSLKQNVVLSNLMHLSDWLPTFNSMAGGDEIGNIDGIDQWDYLAEHEYLPGHEPRNPRNGLLVTIDEEKGSAALIAGDWKLVRLASSDFRSYYSNSGRTVRKYDMDGVLASSTHRLLSKYSKKKLSKIDFWRSRKAASIDDKCKARLRANENANDVALPCFNSTCLFNLAEDSCEFTDFSANYKNKLRELNNILKVYENELVKQWTAQPDPASDPRRHGGYLTPWVY